MVKIFGYIDDTINILNNSFGTMGLAEKILIMSLLVMLNILIYELIIYIRVYLPNDK